MATHPQTDQPTKHVLVDIDVDRGRTWSPKQLQYIYSAHRYPIMYGGYRSGKTDALVRRALRYSLKWPGNRGLMARYSLGESYDTLLVNWAQVVPPELYEIATDRWGWQITVKTEGAPSSILVRALDEPQKYESLELGWVAISQMNEQYVTKRMWDTLDSRLTWKLPDGSHPHYSCFGEANSGAKWIIDLWSPKRQEDDPDEEYEAVEVSMFDNAANLPAETVEALSRKPEWWKRWFIYPCWEPLSERAGEPVFEDHFDFDLHVSPDPVTPVPGWPLIRGWDLPGPVAVVWFQVLRNECRVLYELQAEPGDAIEQVKQVVKNTHNTLFPGFACTDYADPAAFTKSPTDQKTCAELLRPEITLLPGERTITGRLEAGRLWMDRLNHSKPALSIDPRCRILIGGLAGGYAWKPSAGVLLPEPQKNEYSHVIDAWLHGLARVSALGDLGPESEREIMGPRVFGPRDEF